MRPSLSQILKEFRHHRDRTIASHIAASWLPAKTLAVIEGFASPTSAVPTDSFQPPLTTRPITTDLRERTLEAEALAAAGDIGAARDAYADLVSVHDRVLGPDDPETLRARDWHAYCMAEAGDAAGASDLYADLVPDRIRVLGPDHPDTLHAQMQYARYTAAAK